MPSIQPIFYTTFTVSIATPAVISLKNHGFQTNDLVIFTTTGALPTGLSVDTWYWVIADGLTDDTFRISSTKGGSAINTTGTQSGTHTLGTDKGIGIRPYDEDNK